MKATFQTLLILVISYLYLSCESGAEYFKTVVNDSSETITLDVYPKIGSNNAIVVLEPRDAKLIWLRYSKEVIDQDEYDCVFELDSIIVTVTNQKQLVLNLFELDNWEFSKSGDRIEMLNCLLTIKEEDLQ